MELLLSGFGYHRDMQDSCSLGNCRAQLDNKETVNKVQVKQTCVILPLGENVAWIILIFVHNSPFYCGKDYQIRGLKLDFILYEN